MTRKYSILKLEFTGIVLMALLILIQPADLTSQSRSFSTLPLINSGNFIQNSTDNLKDSLEYQHVAKIYNKLVEARGDYRYPVPNFAIRDEEGMVASMDYSVNEITLEKKAYDACKKYGDAGIAFLLGHELTHYYEKHAWKGAFAQENLDLDLGKKLSDIQSEVAYETEADYLGGFLAYTAGYGMFDQGANVINDLYDAYELPENLDGYPSKSDRIQLCNRSADKLNSLVELFDMGNMLYAIGFVEDAYLYYKYILNYYQSRELYNNLGTISMLSAIDMIGQNVLKFTYATELDIKIKGARSPENKQDTINRYLNSAILFLNSAINLDPNYAPAYLNKANAYALKGELSKAKFYLEEEALPSALKDSMKYAKTIEDAWVLKGILASRNGDNDAAKKHFMVAKDMGSNVAIENLGVLKKMTASPVLESSSDIARIKSMQIPNRDLFQANSSPGNFTADQIGSINIKKYLTGRPKVDNKDISLEEGCVFFKYTPTDSVGKISMHRRPDRNYYMAFLSTTEGYDGQTSLGISIGSSEADVFKKYGNDPKSLETTQGRILIYPTIVFIITKDQVTRWSTYQLKESRF